MMRILAALMLLAQLATNPPPPLPTLPDAPPGQLNPPNPTPTISIVAHVVHFDPWASGADIVVKVQGDNRYIRLIYHPYDWGFDAPLAPPSDWMPDEMFQRGEIAWKFDVHGPSSNQHKLLCASTPKSGIRGKKTDKLIKAKRTERIILVPRELSRVPESEADEPPAIQTLSCMVVVSWTNAGTGESGPASRRR